MPVNFTGSYSQNFDSLANTGTNNAWTNDTTLPGWFLFRQPAPSTAITTYDASDGGSNTGNFYSYGAIASNWNTLVRLVRSMLATIPSPLIQRTTSQQALITMCKLQRERSRI